MKIHVLDRAVAERIAAGEVVERPASVIKELVENSIDAGATAIAIDLREGGAALIRVSDNGCGMTREDAALAVERFATSKLERAQDLNAIGTLGFRGEALPSVASVSHLEILTRPRDAADVIEGTRVRVIDGRIETSVAGAPMGTQVTVQNLFYNAPARGKFLKSPLRETELVQKTLIPYALAYPQIAFRLMVDGRESLVAPAATPLERIGTVWGREVAGEMLELNYASMDLTVTGFVSRPTLVRSSREWQLFFVNGRPIRSGLLAITLERAYAGRIPPNRHPLALIQVQVAPDLVDVNVHPRKAEVRLYQERAIYGAVAQGVEQALRNVPVFSAAPSAWHFADTPVALPGTDVPVLTAREEPEEYVSPVNGWSAVAQIHNTYILAQSPDGMVIIDQHAAQEQVYYELLTTAAGGEPRDVDVQIPLSAREADLILKHLLEYRSLGIECEAFGENTVRVAALPAFVPLDVREFLTALITEHERNRSLSGDALVDKLAAKAACISAVKAGDALDAPGQQSLLDQLAQTYAPATCPHGRPVFVTMRLEDLERRFLRR